MDKDDRIDWPAFPNSNTDGMSLRDWLAGQALIGMVSNPAMVMAIKETSGQRKGKDAEITANCCYEYADAMLRARENK